MPKYYYAVNLFVISVLSQEVVTVYVRKSNLMCA